MEKSATKDRTEAPAFQDHKVNAWAAVFAVASLLLSYASGLQNYLGNQSLDFLFQARGALPAPDNIVIVAIDEPSFGVYNLQWPWPRGLHAELVSSLTRAGAKTIALDIIFAEESAEAQDTLLQQAMAEHGNVILAADIQQIQVGGYQQVVNVLPVPRLIGSYSSTALATLSPDSDGVIRRGSNISNKQFSFAWLAAFKQQDAACCAEVDAMATQSTYINFHGPARQIPTVSYYQAVEADDALPEGTFKDKLVFVGSSVQNSIEVGSNNADYFPVPYSGNSGYMSGVEIHANLASTFLNDNRIRDMPGWVYAALAVMLAMLLVLCSIKAKPLVTVSVYLLAFTLVLILAVYLFTSHNVFLPVSEVLIPATLALVFAFVSQYYTHYNGRKLVDSLFSAYIAPEIRDKLIADRRPLELGGVELTATVFFMDIEGFTQMSEKVAPAKLVEILNRVLGLASDIVIRHDGIVDKYIGDAVMAVWGAPLQTTDHAQKACDAAREIVAAITDLNYGGTLAFPLKVRIGINTGIVLSGNIGGPRHLSFTVIGDEVNMASRTEGLNKHYGTAILLTETTAKRLSDAYFIREIDTVQAKGKLVPVTIFELVTSDISKQANSHFAKACRSYREQNWAEARSSFNKVLSLLPEDGPTTTLLARCEEYSRSPPGADWDGIHRFTEK